MQEYRDTATMPKDQGKSLVLSQNPALLQHTIGYMVQQEEGQMKTNLQRIDTSNAKKNTNKAQGIIKPYTDID